MLIVGLYSVKLTKLFWKHNMLAATRPIGAVTSYAATKTSSQEDCSDSNWQNTLITVLGVLVFLSILLYP